MSDSNIVDIKAEAARLREKAKRDKEKYAAADEVADRVTGAQYKNREESEDKSKDLKEMNFRYAFVHSLGGKPMIKTTVYNEFHKKEIVEFITPESLIQIYANRQAEETITDKRGAMQLGKWWLQHVYRKDYVTATFEPDKAPGEYHVLDQYKVQRNDPLEDKYVTYFNMWEGFGVEPKKGNWKKFIAHIYRILCNSDPVKFKYTMRWLAWAVQNPGEPAQVAMIFKGRKGAGKGVILQTMVKIFGRHGMTIANREHLTGKHNEHLSNCSFLFADEAYHPGDKEVEGILKNLITEPSLTTEPKFRNIKTSRNCLHIVMATNADWVIPATEDERRYFINEVENKYAKSAIDDSTRQEYFNGLWKELADGGYSAILYGLQQMQLGDWHPRNDVPETAELRKQIAMSLPKLKHAFLTMLEDGIFPGSRNGSGECVITRENLTEYLQSLDSNNKTLTGKAVAKLCDDLGIKKLRTNKARHLVFPELDDLRRKWVKTVSKVDWRYNEEWDVSNKF